MQLAGLAKAVADRTLLSGILLATIIAVELVSPRDRYSLKSRVRGIGFYLAQAAAAAATLFLLQHVWARIGVRPLLVLRLEQWFGWAGPFTMIVPALVALLITDFFGYWFHRAQHALLWPIHAVHHSIEELHGANSYGHIADEACRFVFMVIPMSLVPMSGGDLPLVGLLFALSQFYIHSPTKLHFGPLRRFITDNRYHRIHHSRDPRHFDRNFGTTFTVWDQLFGTAYFPATDEWPETGLAEVRQPRTWREWLDLPLRFRRA